MQQRRVGSLEQLEGLQMPCSGVGVAELCSLLDVDTVGLPPSELSPHKLSTI